jgi:3D (Asp-Asp-Asp) domain-containing protein
MRSVLITVLVGLTLATPAVSAPTKKSSKMLVTYYWLIDETSARYRGKTTAMLQNVSGEIIARTSRRFRRDLIMEGGGQLRDGRTVIFDRKVGGKMRFRLTETTYGCSILGCPLVPYRTIAVDPHVVKLGSTVFIPQLKGARLPDGTIHDGLFQADDRGHFRGRHIDIFIGVGAKSVRPFARKGYASRSHVNVRVVPEATPDECLRKVQGHS